MRKIRKGKHNLVFNTDFIEVPVSEKEKEYFGKNLFIFYTFTSVGPKVMMVKDGIYNTEMISSLERIHGEAIEAINENYNSTVFAAFSQRQEDYTVQGNIALIPLVTQSYVKEHIDLDNR